MTSPPFVTCIMPTAGRRSFVPQAIRYFLGQDYSRKELLIVDDGPAPVVDLVPQDSRIRYFYQPEPKPVGYKRNFACEQASGEIVAHWDDDDWSAPWRLSYQVEQLVITNADICGLEKVYFYAPGENRAWEYFFPPGQRRWVYGASLCYRKTFWQAHRFQEINVGEDTRFVWAEDHARIHALSDSRFFVALIHGGNTSPKQTGDARYRAKAVAEIEEILGDDLKFYRQAQTGRVDQAATVAQSTRQPSALVTAALGIGDILRMTPLVRVLHEMGYIVDVLVATDYPDTALLIDGAPEIRRVFQMPSLRSSSAPDRISVLADEEYELATYTAWSAALREKVRSKRALAFERQRWLAEGDLKCVETIARELGWQGELPRPFALKSKRHFGLPAGTIAIHAGCKYEWPWKKWHGFDELAQRFPSVVIVGSEEDARTGNTYFQRAFTWPKHAQNYIGKLNLPDTAALLSECVALISNDSGLMHLGVTLGVQTFGIFGITSPQREGMRSKNFHPITKGLPCEQACHAGTWGRRDCEFHLTCLKTLGPEEVFMKVSETLSAQDHKLSLALSDSSSPKLNGHHAVREPINLTYYGNVFDASGYGHAARAYLHALHTAGIELRVVDLATGRPRQVEDPLLERFVGRPLDTDFHLFHGPPPHWARLAFPLRNVIAMTVWETDTMPTQWRPVLTHAVDVWLPCEFNTAVFSAALGKPVFKLPHPVFPSVATEGTAFESSIDAEIRPGDYVFYAIFEWQDRKSPEQTMEAYFRTFSQQEETVLVLKTNPGAATVADQALAEIRRRTGSRARAVVRAEAWTEAQIAALHERGDCYVSLHRGEGWGYPLFQAATRGKPVIATSYSGPLEYISADAHSLVRYKLTSVRQPYVYYHPSMKWAEPDIAHAGELMRAVRSRPEEARDKAIVAAKDLNQRFSLEVIGRSARARLTELLRNTAKRTHVDRARLERHLRPPIPIPSKWFDADYFEHGIKSNWAKGYQWSDFAGLFRDTAKFLVSMFPEAASFLDAGCAKGFLVRALRELGKDAWGFDHSVWALEHAEKLARPFLKLASTENAEFDRSFDLTLAFSLLECLTETQAVTFLRRAKNWTNQALVAVVLICEDERHRKRLLTSDGDLSRVTIQSRAWWRKRFLDAGWKQDALHRVAERACCIHPLPMRMGWEIFACAP
jgi:ADP-heptose:LPS heptosyltransferase/2-polyprenyl-3-methyl-5-hydroxy-6-metoxy-1,4-benzoquinol methylase